MDHSPLEEVESLCAEFESQLERGVRPDWGSYLARASDEVRLPLVRSMLQIDLRARRIAGETPRVDEYVARLPEYRKVVREEFQISTVIHASMIEDTQTYCASPLPELASTVTRLGDYALGRKLGRGAMGAVYAATHVRHGTEVALKTLPVVGGRELELFKREFRALADVNHPNLIGLHALQADGGQWFFTMDLVDGEDFQSYVRPNGRLDESRLRESLSQLASGVQALHSRGIVHRDLKSTNVMVDRDGVVQLLDFGVVLDLTQTTRQSETAGTPAYMAPEQFSEATTTAASDWYAVGVMLYYALAGRLPFTGTITEIFRDKQTKEPPALPTGTPEDLAELCRRLLERNADERAGASAILRSENQSSQAPLAVPVTGRTKQVQLLESSFREFEQGDLARTVFISGRSGEGKTLLAEYFLNRYRSNDRYTVLSGRCYDRESVPFKAIDTLIDALARYLRSSTDAGQSIVFSPDMAFLAELFPVLKRVDAIAHLPSAQLENIEVEAVRNLAAAALRSLFGEISKRTTLIIFIDDLQWGDADSSHLLLNVLRPPDSPHVLFLGTYRTDESDGSRFLQQWQQKREQLEIELPHDECRLEPLSEADCIQLVVDIIGTNSPAVHRRAKAMAKETGGNPFLLSELASCLDPVSDLEQPMQIDEVVERKLSQLPDDARALLEVISVSGQPLAVEEATGTAGHSAVPLSTITRMRTERLLRLVGNDSAMTVDTYHDRIRETVLREMDGEKKRGLHVRLAEEIHSLTIDATGETQPPSTTARVYDLAYHFYEGGDARAFEYQLKAGEAASRVFALEDGLEYLRRAAQLLPDDADAATRYRVWERLGNACARTKQTVDGLDCYHKAASFAATKYERAVAHDGIGEMHHRMGEFDAAITALDDSLRELGYKRPTWLPRVGFDTTWQLALVLLGTPLVRPKKTEEARRTAAMASESFHRIAQILLIQGKIGRYTAVCTRMTVTALQSGNPDSITRAFAKLASNTSAFSFEWIGRWILRRSKRRSVDCIEPATHAALTFYDACLTYLAGDLEQSMPRFESAIRQNERIGESWLATMMYHWRRHAWTARGDSEQALECSRVECENGRAINDREAVCWGQFGMADSNARLGRLHIAYQQMGDSWATFARNGGVMTESVALNHEAFLELQSSRYERAREILEKSKRIIEDHFLHIEFAVRTYLLLIECAVGPDWLTRRRRKEIQLTRRDALRARFFGWRFPLLRSHSLRACGRLHAACGRLKRARRCLEKSIAEGRRIGTQYDEARALLDLSVVDTNRQTEFRNEAVGILKRLKSVIPYAERWQLGDVPDPACVAPEYRPDDRIIKATG